MTSTQSASFSFDNLVKEISSTTIFIKWIDGPENFSKSVIMTTYYLKGQLQALIEISIRFPEAFILFVGYHVKLDGTGGGDMQPGLTGSCVQSDDGKYEKVSHAASRELTEETGFSTSSLQWFDTSELDDKFGRHATIYLVDASTITVAESVPIVKGESTKKVSVIPYGTYEQIVTIAKNARPVDEDEGIGYYAAVSVHHAVKMLERARTFKNKKSLFVYDL